MWLQKSHTRLSKHTGVQNPETTLSVKLLPVSLQPQVSTQKSSSKQTTRGSGSDFMAGCDVGAALENITLMAFPVVAFEGKYLFRDDCKSQNSRMLASPYVYRINRIEAPTNTSLLPKELAVYLLQHQLIKAGPLEV